MPSDNLRRRIDEIDALLAIFDTAIELVSVDEIDGARRAIQSGSDVTNSSFTFRFVVTHDDGTDDDQASSAVAARCEATIRMPDDYPESSPLELVSIMSESLSRQRATELLESVRDAATGPGEESAYQVVTALEERFKEVMREVRAEGAAKRTVESDAGVDEDDYHAVISINHMNDSREYLKTVKKWCAAHGLSARVLHKPSITKRIEGCYVALRGSNDGIKSFLTRLRTDIVDVDANGNRCKERQSTLHCHRKSTTVKTGEQPIANFEGFVVEEPYENESALEEALARLNLLHVGDGSQRFI